jgi:PA14 domain/Lectin C-type domain
MGRSSLVNNSEPRRPGDCVSCRRWAAAVLTGLLLCAGTAWHLDRLSRAAESGGQPATQPTVAWPRSAPPDAAKIADGEKLVHGVFKEAFDPAAVLAQGEVQRKANFARRFLLQGILAEDDPAERYVLLRDARDFAAAGGDPDTAMRAVARLDQLFHPRPLETRDAALEALVKSSKKVMSPDASERNALAIYQMIEAALTVGDYDLARRAVEASGQIREPALQDLVKSSATLLAGIEEQAAAARAAGAKLAGSPEDAPSNLTAGTYLCIGRGDWDAGVALLAKGSDAQLKALAAAEAGAKDAPASLAVADEWWEAAGAKSGRAREAMRRRAAHWYVLAAPGLPAAQREQAEKRLGELRLSTLRPGLITDLYDGQDFQRHQRLRLDPNIDVDWHNSSPGPGMGADHFSVCWQGRLQAPKPGKYDIEIDVDDGVYVRLDGRQIADEWHDAGPLVHLTVELTGQPQAFEFLYVQVTGAAYCHLKWKPPGEQQMTVIPPSAFSHDPVWPWGPTAGPTGCRPADAEACTAPGAPTVWFKRFEDQLPWHAAQRRCEQMGGHLAWSLRPEHEEALLRVSAGKTLWLGGADEVIEGRWEWTSGRRIDPDQTNWLEGEPNGGRDENYLVVKFGRGWNDSGERNGFICQWDR